MLRALLAAALLLPLPVRADPETDVGLLEDCLGPADSMEGPGGRDCIGVVSQLCHEAPGGETTVGAAACLLRERDAWDVLLNRHYQELRKAQTDPARTALRNAQRAWIAFRDADCSFAYEQFAGGSIRQITGATCQRDRTAERVLHLRGYLAWGQ